MAEKTQVKVYDSLEASGVLNVTQRRIRALARHYGVGTRMAGDRLIFSESDMRILRDRQPDRRLLKSGIKCGVRPKKRRRA